MSTVGDRLASNPAARSRELSSPRGHFRKVVAPEAAVEPGELVARIVEAQAARVGWQLAPHPFSRPRKHPRTNSSGQSRCERPTPRSTTCTSTSCHRRAGSSNSGRSRPLASRLLHTHASRGAGPPRRVNGARGHTDVFDDVCRRAPGTGLDLSSSPGVACLVLVDHLASKQPPPGVRGCRRCGPRG